MPIVKLDLFPAAEAKAAQNLLNLAPFFPGRSAICMSGLLTGHTAAIVPTMRLSPLAESIFIGGQSIAC
jgi:hypothetical protein